MKRFTKFFCLMFALLHLFSVGMAAGEEKSAGNNNIYVKACGLSTGKTGLIYLLLDGKIPYINESGIEALTGFHRVYPDEAGQYRFTNGTEIVRYQNDVFRSDGTDYYHLQHVMDALRASYYYVDENQTLYFYRSQSNPGNVYAICSEIFKTGNFDLQIDQNEWGVGLATVYNVLGDLRIDYLWGNYQKEMALNTLCGILDNGTVTAAKWAEEAYELLEDYNSSYAFASLSPDGTRTVCGMFGLGYESVNQMHEMASEKCPGISISDTISIWKTASSVEQAAAIYLRAIEDGLFYTETEYSSPLHNAVIDLHDYYIDNRPDARSVIEDLLERMPGNVASGMIEHKLFEQALGIQSPYVAITKALLDRYGMDQKTTAVEQTAVCKEIQAAAKANYLHHKQFDRPVKMKYCTLLYLRAVQYAYSLYDFEPELKWAVELMIEKTQAYIDRLAALDDQELSIPYIHNAALDVTQPGFIHEEIEKPHSDSAEPTVSVPPTTVPSETPSVTEAPSVTETPLQQNSRILEDGVYTILVDRNSFQDLGDCWHAVFHFTIPLTYRDEDVASLKIGMTIEDTRIESMSYMTSHDGSHYLYINGDHVILHNSLQGGLGLWYSQYPSDTLKMITLAPEEYCTIPKNIVMYDEMAVYSQRGPHEVLSPWDFFSEYDDGDSIELEITFENNRVTSLVKRFHP